MRCLILLTLLATTACSTGDATDKAGSKIKDEVATNSAKKLPKGFPLPVFDGAKVVSGLSGVHGGRLAFSVSMTTPEKVETVGAFYQKVLEAKGFKVRKTAHTATGTLIVNVNGTRGTGKDEIAAKIDITIEDGETLILISWTEPK